MFVINIDLSQFLALEKMPEKLQKVTNKIAQDYAEMIYGKGVELAHERLHARLEPFMEHFRPPKELAGEQGTWLVSLDEKWVFLDDGRPKMDLLPYLLKSSSADAFGNVIVPFKHGPGKGPARTSPAQLDLINTIKSEMRKKNIPFNKIEMGEDGKAKMGRLHAFDISTKPKKEKEGPFQGSGPLGQPRQGHTGIPLLHGVTVYQKPDAKAKSGARKEIFTFRTASPKQRGKNMWISPAIEKAGIMEDAAKWGEDHVDQYVMDRIMAEIDKL